MNLIEKIKRSFPNFGGTNIPANVSGNTVGRYVYANGVTTPIVSQTYVKSTQPYGTKIPTMVKDRASGWSQMQNLSHNFTMEKVQAAFRAAESGDCTLLWAYYRDFFLGSSIAAAAITKRKLSTMSEAYNILPFDKKNPIDVRNANVIKEILTHTPDFNDCISHMLNAVVYPISAIDKTFEPVGHQFGDNKYDIRYKIKQLYPIDYQLINFRLPYLPRGPINLGSSVSLPNLPPSIYGRPEDTIWDPDSYEPNLRFWSVLENGLIDYSYANMQQPDPNRHLIHRCNLLNGICRENFGGLGKSLLFLTIMSQMGLDKFTLCLQKYGLPFIKIKADESQVDTVNQIIQTFGDMSTLLNAIAVNKDAEVELTEMNYSNAAEAHTKFLQFIKDQIDTLVLGQVLSGDSKSTGLGSGVANLHADVREDYIHFDRLCLNNTLRYSLFRQLLDINGFTDGECPNITWGGGNSTSENKELSTIILNLTNAGYALTDESVEELGCKFGFTFKSMNQATPISGSTNASNINTPPTEPKTPENMDDTPITAEDIIKQKVLDNGLGQSPHNN